MDAESIVKRSISITEINLKYLYLASKNRKFIYLYFYKNDQHIATLDYRINDNLFVNVYRAVYSTLIINK
jgi:hypothetical protein